jgi:hypothetical protein
MQLWAWVLTAETTFQHNCLQQQQQQQSPLE